MVGNRTAVPRGPASLPAWALVPDIAEGGTERGHGISIARGDRPRARSSRPRRTRSCPPARRSGRCRTPATATSSRPRRRVALRLLGAPPQHDPRFSALGRETFVTTCADRSTAGRRSTPCCCIRARARASRSTSRPTELDGEWLAIRRLLPNRDLDGAPGWLTLHGDGRRSTTRSPSSSAAGRSTSRTASR